MKRKKLQSVVRDLSALDQSQQAQQEIETYLNALNSYPEHFARDPFVSFEQHLFSIVAGRATLSENNCNLD